MNLYIDKNDFSILPYKITREYKTIKNNIVVKYEEYGFLWFKLIINNNGKRIL